MRFIMQIAMRALVINLLFISLILSCYHHIHIAEAKEIKVPSDIKVEDEPGEDECDYSFYLWRILNNEVQDIDYYTVCIILSLLLPVLKENDLLHNIFYTQTRKHARQANKAHTRRQSRATHQ